MIRFKLRVPQLPDLSHLSHAEKDALIRALWERLEAAERRIADLEARLSEPSKTPDNSSLPPSRVRSRTSRKKLGVSGRAKVVWAAKVAGRPLACDPDETVTTKTVACVHCQAALTDADQVLYGRYDKIDLPVVRPVVTRVERYAGHCPCCGGVTLAPVPAGMEEGSPFSANILALTIYLRFTHAISYQRLTRLFLHLFASTDQRGCAGCDVAACQARLGQRGGGNPHPATPVADYWLG